MVHILTHNDLDGYAAGYIVSKYFHHKRKSITFLNYDKEPVIENYQEGDIVVITDYSLSNDQYEQILERIGDDGHLIWCDHHKTAIDRYNQSDVCCEGIRSTKYCGAVLAYLYFETAVDTEEVEEWTYEKIMEEIPEWLRYVDAWDTWKLDSEYRKGAERLNLAVSNILSETLMADISKDVHNYIKIGRYYEAYRNQWAKTFRDNYMFHKTLSGKLFGTDRDVKACILTLGNANSEFFGDEIDKSDVCITQCFNGEKWKVSVYSNKPDIDCGLYCQTFGGGGHKGAAGCYFEQINPPGFICEDIEILRKELYNMNVTKNNESHK
mgnify:CR=1 FL=1|jgi:oligoribonuclease NrnB/cAMP/cGMP phosphodiesterase (DHH superfamily)